MSRLALFHGLLLNLALAAFAPTLAQDAAPAPLEDPRAPKFNDVERGFFVGFEAGWVALTRTPNQDPVKFPFATGGGGTAQGAAIGLHLGYDLTSRFAVALFAEGAELKASPSYGAFDLLAAGHIGEFMHKAVLEIDQSWHAHGRGGYLISHPTGLFTDTDVLIGGGLGAEYFTQLRHFSVGLRIDGLYVLAAKAPGFAIAPVVRYTF